jgi:hypothetical protein
LSVVKPSQNRLREARRQGSEAVVEKRLAELFRRMPMLCGFSMRDDVELTNVAVHTWPGPGGGQAPARPHLRACSSLIRNTSCSTGDTGVPQTAAMKGAQP